MNFLPTKIIDDAVSKETQELVYKKILSSPWAFMTDVTGIEQKNPSMGFCSVFKIYNQEYIAPLFEEVCVPLIAEIAKNAHIEYEEISLARSYLQLPLAERFIKEHNGVHVDCPKHHYVVVYYVNDADGESFVYEENFPQIVNNPSLLNKQTKLHEHIRVPAKKGRALLFDGYRFHASSQPTNNYRCILDFNLLGVKELD